VNPGPPDLRALVREILSDVLSAEAAGAGSVDHHQADPTVPTVEVDDGAETVAVATDADLDAFVRRLVQLFENPVYRRDVKAGRIRFRLAAAGSVADDPAAPTTRPDTAAVVVRIDRGAVTEARVREVARSGSGSRIVLGRAAVITPLARDRARALGVAVERER